jgi:protein-S-isoprenylcysteine O-methyltransferase Ste14
VTSPTRRAGGGALLALAATLPLAWWTPGPPGLRAALAVLGTATAVLFARWTGRRTHLTARATVHVICHAVLLLWVLPRVTEALGGGWHPFTLSASWETKLLWQVLLLPAVFLVSAVQEFAARGGGTPMPDDPPVRLVTTGLFAYVANPMQVGKLSILACWGALWGNPWLLAAAALGGAYSVFVACPREDLALEERYGASWRSYRAHVGRWWPRWRPWPMWTSARLYLDQDCPVCGQLGRWLESLAPPGLEVQPAVNHPDAPLARPAYEPGDGTPEEHGVVAVARALEHIHLGWAFLGCAVRLPLIRVVAQAVYDAVAPPRRGRAAVSAR